MEHDNHGRYDGGRYQSDRDVGGNLRAKAGDSSFSEKICEK